jgi:hypothetical protein
LTGRVPRAIAFDTFAIRSLSNLSFAMESSVSKSTDVDDDTSRASFFGLGTATSSGSGFRFDGGMSNVKVVE